MTSNGGAKLPFVDVRSLAYRTDLAVLGHQGAVFEHRPGYMVVRSPHNALYWWGNFVLLAEPPPPYDQATEWVDRCAWEFPGAKHTAIGIDGTGVPGSALQGFKDLGLDVEDQVVLTCTPVATSSDPPAGCVLRSLSTGHDWEQCAQLTLLCSKQTDEVAEYEAFVRANAAAKRRAVEGGHGKWLGVFINGHLVSELGIFTAGDGFVRFHSVETAPAYRRRGLASALILHAHRLALEEMGAKTSVMVADPAGPAIHLYHRLGFVSTERQIQVQGRYDPSRS